MVGKYRTKDISVRKRRRGKDDSVIAFDIHIFRWWYFFMKLGVECDLKFTRKKIKYVVYSPISFSFPDTIRTALESHTNFISKTPSQQTKEFNKFWKVHKSHFIEKKIEEITEVKDDDFKNYNILKIPKGMNQRNAEISMRTYFKSKRKNEDWRKSSESKKVSSTAQIQFKGKLYDIVMNRYFRIFKLKETTKFDNSKIISELNKTPFGIYCDNPDDEKRILLKNYERTKNSIINSRLNNFYSIQDFDKIPDTLVDYQKEKKWKNKIFVCRLDDVSRFYQNNPLKIAKYDKKNKNYIKTK